MARRRPRNLSAEERSLWSLVARSAKPLHPVKQSTRPTLSKPKDSKPKPVPAFEVQDFRIGETARSRTPGHALAPSVSEHLAHAPVRMDHSTHKKMLRGKLAPEARIDLHGMTLAQAHPELNRFIFEAHAQDKRLVLVITGKGRHREDQGPIPIRRGVLKHQVPAWLNTPPLASMVLNIREAHLKHGGTGAYYVYLRRSR